MQYHYRQNAVLWIIALGVPLFGPAMPAAHAQPEILADWQAKEKAGSYAEPLSSDKKVTFTGAAEAFRSGNFADPGDALLFADMYEKRYFPLVTHPESAVRERIQFYYCEVISTGSQVIRRSPTS